MKPAPNHWAPLNRGETTNIKISHIKIFFSPESKTLPIVPVEKDLVAVQSQGLAVAGVLLDDWIYALYCPPAIYFVNNG